MKVRSRFKVRGQVQVLRTASVSGVRDRFVQKDQFLPPVSCQLSGAEEMTSFWLTHLRRTLPAAEVLFDDPHQIPESPGPPVEQQDHVNKKQRTKSCSVKMKCHTLTCAAKFSSLLLPSCSLKLSVTSVASSTPRNQWLHSYMFMTDQRSPMPDFTSWLCSLRCFVVMAAVIVITVLRMNGEICRRNWWWFHWKITHPPFLFCSVCVIDNRNSWTPNHPNCCLKENTH